MISRRRKLWPALLLAVFGITAIVFLYCGFIFSSDGVLLPLTELQPAEVTSENCDHHCVAYLARLDRYCHRSLLNGEETASEGQLLDNTLENFRLKHVHVVVRHGDRTPVEAYKIGSSIFYQCGLVDNDIIWNGLRDFPQPRPLPSDAMVLNARINLHPGNHNRRCGVGKLTQTGFKQHYRLGQLLRSKYTPLLTNISDYSRNMFVHSTDTSRTVHSGAAFLLGFLPDNSQLRGTVPIHVSAGTIHDAPPTGVRLTYPHCSALHDYHVEELERSKFMETQKKHYSPLFEKLSKLFHVSILTTPTKIFDHFGTRMCHAPKYPLPCGQHECIDFEFALQFSSLCDWIWSNKYPLNTSILSALPFLKHSVLDPMELSVSRGKEDERESPNYDVMLTFSHDDTITMILNSLGVHMNEWIPYASRVVFELWQEKEEDYYVRILFNGQVVTDRVFPWALYQREDLHAYRELLPLELWSEFLTSGQFRDPESYNRACRNTV